MDELLDVWAVWPPSVRESILILEDPEIVCILDASLQMLWAADFQAQQFGMVGPSHPYDHSQLPFLSTMQFDIAAAKNGEVRKLVKWRSELHEDVSIVPAALRFSLRPDPSMRYCVKPMNPARWSQLLCPPPLCWADFERQLARLIEQKVLRTHESELRSTGRGNSGRGRCQDAWAPADVPLVDKDVPCEDEVNQDGDISATTSLTGRAAKRARQRDRRKMFKAASRAAAHPEDFAVEPHALAGGGPQESLAGAGRGAGGGRALALPAGALPLATVKTSVVWRPPGLWTATDHLAGDLHEPEEPDNLAARMEQIEESKIQATAGVEAESRCIDEQPGRQATNAEQTEAGERKWRERSSEDVARKVSDELMDEQRVESAERQVATTKEPASRAQGKMHAELPASMHVVHLTLKDLQSYNTPSENYVSGDYDGGSARDVIDDSSPARVHDVGAPKSLTDYWSPDDASAPGVGRGRPINQQKRGLDDMSSHGIGRGRAMAPPPGLHKASDQRRPGGLSVPWIPGPPIPEDEEDPEADITEVGRWLAEMQVSNNLQTGRLTRVRSWSSASSFGAAETPAMQWAETPSPQSTPRMAPASGPLFANVGLQGGSLLADQDSAVSGPIPTYVTVPLATTHCCPHCNRPFALLTDGELQAVFPQQPQAQMAPAAPVLGPVLPPSAQPVPAAQTLQAPPAPQR